MTPTITLGRKSYIYYNSSGYWYQDSFDTVWSTNTIKPVGESDRNGYLWTTGASEEAKRKNLYDVAGNLNEWTEELSFFGGNSNNIYRELRGGAANFSSNTRPVCFRYGGIPEKKTQFICGFRVVLYIK